MSEVSTVSSLRKKFEVTEVAKITAPDGMEGKNWHSYTIKRGATEISGQKPGTLKMVTEHARQVAEDLNARSGGKAGSIYAARRKN
ncbi:MAG: hypothetical protein OQK94_06515 [Gammaproteobacteria bacterium]|nr:hypothetical protein [Gammaproteobacteria bacterium]MCW8959903.1 hypothetical protein [Gammaproteobacteria bacterium]MCW8973844.1 hypothetical protein [Gammaproteobacteria bacterium]MCW8992754.1 hypothetical protein [Gammaproteobacteria bacterium]MCW9087963.1 hypothetical protein [Gammaproteobacteria bacterium]